MNLNNLRGMLLEEAVLFLLRHSGYKTLHAAGDDSSLVDGHSGLEVKGRGSKHQIDAVADYLIPQPFTHPQRLLVEAKHYSTDIGLNVIRNAVGVLKDVNEFWVPPVTSSTPIKRYHYQYAVVSGTNFTSNSQKYAFAQDIYLIPLGASSFFSDVIWAINKFKDIPDVIAFVLQGLELKDLRKWIRAKLNFEYEDEPNISINDIFREFIEACHRISFCLLAVISGRFPVFLVPAEGVSIHGLESVTMVRIYWDNSGWYLQRPNGQVLFSFDLPKELFELYATEGALGRRAALNLKQEMMSMIQAIVVTGDQAKVITFKLDEDWIASIRGRYRGGFNE